MPFCQMNNLIMMMHIHTLIILTRVTRYSINISSGSNSSKHVPNIVPCMKYKNMINELA